MSETEQIEQLTKELDAAVTFARTESDRAKSAEHWREIAERENRKGNQLRNEVYGVLKAEGYNVRSYSEMCLPRSLTLVVEGDKRAPGEFHVLGVVKHLIQRARDAEEALSMARGE